MAGPLNSNKSDDIIPNSQALPVAEFAVEEYKQVLEERRMVMTRFIQAVGFYLALSGFGLRELISTSARPFVVTLSILFSVLNILAVYAAYKFRRMAWSAAEREKFFVQQYRVAQTHELFWGYIAGIWLVILGEVTVVVLAAWKLSD